MIMHFSSIPSGTTSGSITSGSFGSCHKCANVITGKIIQNRPLKCQYDRMHDDDQKQSYKSTRISGTSERLKNENTFLASTSISFWPRACLSYSHVNPSLLRFSATTRTSSNLARFWYNNVLCTYMCTFISFRLFLLKSQTSHLVHMPSCNKLTHEERFYDFYYQDLIQNFTYLASAR